MAPWPGTRPSFETPLSAAPQDEDSGWPCVLDDGSRFRASFARSPKPVILISGYLGAGKTTLVNHLLRNAGGRRIAVAVNEFGALPIDPDLIEQASGDVLTLAGGCICCSFGDDLTSSLVSLAAHENIDCILIETSGVALPGAVAQSLALVAGLKHEATLVLVDAETARKLARDKYLADTILRQLAEADLVVLNKTDLVPDEARANLLRWLADTAPRAKIVETAFGALAPEIAFGAYAPGAFVADAPAPHGGAQPQSQSFEIADALDIARLAALLAAEETNLVRAKGFLRDADGAWKLLQIVGRRSDVTPARAPPDGKGRLVCIAHGAPLERARIETLVRSCSTARG
ncbi:MAG TPA: GTP-binding protein [Rhodoblastus sp.]|mgnify:CR=1 FL=1|nr:GTP-binding protein [Rhodoblastus sp.]